MNVFSIYCNNICKLLSMFFCCCILYLLEYSLEVIIKGFICVYLSIYYNNLCKLLLRVLYIWLYYSIYWNNLCKLLLRVFRCIYSIYCNNLWKLLLRVLWMYRHDLLIKYQFKFVWMLFKFKLSFCIITKILFRLKISIKK